MLLSDYCEKAFPFRGHVREPKAKDKRKYPFTFRVRVNPKET